MTLSQWWQIVALYEVILVWPLALVAFLALLRAKTRRGRVAGVSILVVLFIPFMHRAAGDVYFDYLCEHKAGEFIYRTVDNVEGVLQMRPRDGSKDYFDRMAMGDIPEDPWGHTNWEAKRPSTMFVNPPWSTYKYFESILPNERQLGQGGRDSAIVSLEEPNARIRHYFGYDQKAKQPMRIALLTKPRSLYGYTWEGRQSRIQKLFNVYPGEIRVVHLESQEVLGLSRGFYRSRPRQLCPPGKDNDLVYRFVVRVVRPTS